MWCQHTHAGLIIPRLGQRHRDTCEVGDLFEFVAD